MTIRALRGCRRHKIQEFARIIFVADMSKHVRMPEDHEPLNERPAFESLADVPKIVSSFTQKSNKICVQSIYFCFKIQIDIEIERSRNELSDV